MKRLPLSDEQAREWHEGRLSVVRRRMTDQPPDNFEPPFLHPDGKWKICHNCPPDILDYYEIKPPFLPGEIVFIGETWMGTKDCLSYKISDPRQVIEFGYDTWRSPITMPAWASRSKARIVSVRPEQEGGVWSWVIELGRV